MKAITICISGLGRLLNRLGHRLVRWGYALEMWAYRQRYRGEAFTYKVTFVNGAGEPSAPAEMPVGEVRAPTGKVHIYRGSTFVGAFFGDEPRIDNVEDK